VSARAVATTLVLVALGELTLLAVVVFIGEPAGFGEAAPRFRLLYLVYLTVPLLVMCVAALAPLRDVLRRRSRTQADS
jgi:hypothetical protein